MSGLVERLAEAAVEAIRNERPELEREPERLRGITLDLRLNGRGAVIEGTCYVERKAKHRTGGQP